MRRRLKPRHLWEAGAPLSRRGSGAAESSLAATPLNFVVLRPGTPTSCLSARMPTKKAAANRSVRRKTQLIEKARLFPTELNRGRFARKETKGIQRPETGVAPVSAVRSNRLNPFETKRKKAPSGASDRFCNLLLAEGGGFEPPAGF